MRMDMVGGSAGIWVCMRDTPAKCLRLGRYAVSMLDSQSRGPGGDGSNPTTGEVDTFWADPVHLAGIRYLVLVRSCDLHLRKVINLSFLQGCEKLATSPGIALA